MRLHGRPNEKYHGLFERQSERKQLDPRSLFFAKIHGAGNDFILIDGRYGVPVSEEDLARALCQRYFGVGADGLIVVDVSTTDDFTMRYYNADGSRTVCGNGMRAVALYLVSFGLLASDQKRFQLGTDSGSVCVDIIGKGERSRVALSVPQFDGRFVPCRTPGEYLNHKLSTSRGEISICAVGMGNPHCVVFVDDLSLVDVKTLGAELEHHELFPKAANVEFVEIVNPSEVKMRVWERGVGETLACGTGNCAIIAAGVRTGRLDRRVVVYAPGGSFELLWGDDHSPVVMTGPAELVFCGEVDAATLIDRLGNRDSTCSFQEPTSLQIFGD